MAPTVIAWSRVWPSKLVNDLASSRKAGGNETMRFRYVSIGVAVLERM